MISGTPEFQIEAIAYDVANNPVAIDLLYCSNSMMTASVDSYGLIIGLGQGEAIVKVCAGCVLKEIVVNVSLM